METLLLKSTAAIPHKISSSLKEKIIRYYEEVGPDYEAWSKDFNMHFGFGEWYQIFQREKMLHQMNKEIFKHLKLVPGNREEVIDLGCGVGATMRYGATHFCGNYFTGITLVPWQITKGKVLNRRAGFENEVCLLEADYHQIPFPEEHFDKAFAIESACHAEGKSKEKFIREMYRVLKPGGRFVIADGFIKKPEENLSSIVHFFYKGICNNWALPNMADIHSFKSKLEEAGFKNIEVEDISWKAAPSVLHVPFIISKFLLVKLFKGELFKKQSIRNLKGSFLALILGLCRSDFGYYRVSGEKRK